ncbi:nitrate- and nitrite sensing domain-containing protein [Catenuloplanes sp. NPDC051500]|uniref:sensor histidine kinase n=1 Tax=Catenuloplanes sp. NPDC051500 TaxID=3363959 RepID=UPI0037A4BD7A
MSEQPKKKAGGSAVSSRLRWPGSRLRDLPIWSKLGLIMIVPTMATIVVGTSGLIDHIDEARDADQARTIAQLEQFSGELVDTLQSERAAAARFLSTPNQQRDEKGKLLEAFNQTHSLVDSAKKPYSQQRTLLTDLPQEDSNFESLLDAADASLEELPATRSQVSNNSLQLSQATASYDIFIEDLLRIRESASQLAGSTALSDRMRASAALALEKEYVSTQRVIVHDVFAQGEITPKLRETYIATLTGQQQAGATFETVATREDRDYRRQEVAGPDLREATLNTDKISANLDGEISALGFTPQQWDEGMAGKNALMRKVEQRLDDETVTLATQTRNEVQRRVLVETGVLLGMLLLAILFAWLVARSMARSLRELRQGALSVAQYGLPQAVARLRDPAISAQLSPVQVANQIAEPLPVRSRDEFGQVTEAFNAVHLEAVRTAAEQAVLRASVSTMFVNLARRSQILVDRLIGHLDRLERGEEDPDRLAELFQLDHLATRMRRNDENLLVLAGADSTRVQREPAALIDVLRAAQSEVEHYTRIHFGNIDKDIEISAHAVNDLVHLVAELFDNATAFSPPDSKVMVEARVTGDRAVLYVEDRGIGIAPDQMRDLNERLQRPPTVDVTVSRMMGLVVVARLGARHGVRVELRAANERGTVADVVLPANMLMSHAVAGGRAPAAVGGPRQDLPAFGGGGGQGGGFGSPLALEPGGSGRPPSQRESAPSLGGFATELPQSFAGFGNDPAPTSGGPSSSRSMPAWSDLTGAAPSGGNGSNGGSNGGAPNGNGNNGFGSFNGFNGSGGGPRNGRATDAFGANGSRSEGLPHRPRTDEPMPMDDYAGPASPTIPRQKPVSPEQQRGGVPPLSVPPVASAPPASGPSSASSAPPVWPPIAPTDNPPSVPDRLASSLDLTAEIPRYRPENAAPPALPASRPQSVPPVQQVPVSAMPVPGPVSRPAPQAASQPVVDETMELPIFRELESAWFRTRVEDGKPATGPTGAGPTPAPATAASAPTEQYRTLDTKKPELATTSRGLPTPGARSADPLASRPVPAGDGNAQRISTEPASWRTAADDGWRTAASVAAAAGETASETTQAGLPKRKPMAQLVPGGIEKATPTVNKRSPEGVRGLLSAYHRGVQRGRTGPSDNPTGSEGTLDGQQSSQAGKEHEG